jgi:type I pantothenate kinase
MLDGFVTYTVGEWAAAVPPAAPPRSAAHGIREADVVRIYAPLAERVRDAVGAAGTRVPVIAVVGSVSVGKSTTARVLAALLGAVPDGPRAAVVSADGFLFPNEELRARGLFDRKGFPESYDEPALVTFLSHVHAGERGLRVPVYSHERYDVLEETEPLDDHDVLVVEGLHLLRPSIRDRIDFGVYLDADERDILAWFTDRMRALRDEALHDPTSFFTMFADYSDDELVALADHTWRTINGRNLHEHILPTRPNADVVLEKQADHTVRRILVRSGASPV